jgi:hypothetical protein
MKKKLTLSTLSDYPEWHDQPFKLTVPEIKNPHLVLDDFFQLYSLSNARVCLKQWLEDALSADGVNPISHLTFYDHVEKLIEAAYSVNRLKSAKNEEGDCEKDEDNDEDNDVENNEDNDEEIIEENELELETSRFTKQKRLVDRVKENPNTGIIDIFQLIELNDLKANLNCWLKVALSNERGIYDEAQLRADLICFTDQLLILIEAMYIKSEVYRLQRPSDWTSELPKSIRDEIKRNNHISLLSSEQINEPDIVLEQFSNQFSNDYCRVELWDLLDAVISYEDDLIEGYSRLNVLLYYECFSCLIDSAYIIKKKRFA